MLRFKNYIAFFLLLLFVRVLAPETTVLAFHSHEHTEDSQGLGCKFEKKHQHCHIHDLFNAPFAPAQTIAIKVITPTFTDAYATNCSFVWKYAFPNNCDLRGPPIV
ncbi:hypothetical protein [Adhaeribacter radiodurans]|uniref:Uncharacterized protein n=1 Tax=Adhaeribacter radiodurans TaxID=2745197 RepID=A0A7L7LA22_9BACT|nr:hypothetical protein [Adhaeribacter radiodurans]QMU29670.1 hypothetical protein HUW48_17265 [Adhaeribacter radiodurans]